jgi:very-short-patch-repair endonuclease
MSGRSFSRYADLVITRLASRQHGVVAREQLLAAGVSAHQVDWRIRARRLHPIHAGVYLVGHAVPTEHATAMAALLACGEEAVLSHRSAASLWRLLSYPATAPAWVTVPPERSAARPRIKISRANLDPRDIRHRHGMPLTSPPRTILDLSPSLDEYELEALVAEASYRNLASEPELRSQLKRNPRKRGVARLRSVLDLPGGPRRTRSPSEREMLRLLRRSGIDGYETNAKVHTYEVDFLWRDRSFAVEVDGYDAHSGRVAFERDRLKAATLNANGITVMPITGRQIRRDPDGILGRLLAALARSE